jgi:tryptophan synthase alpha chain
MDDVTAYLQRLKAMKLRNQVLVGFGIKDRQTFNLACAHANGAIIGTAYIKVLENAENITEATRSFLQNVL